MHSDYTYGYEFGLWGILGTLIHLLFWLFIIILIVRFVRHRRHGHWGGMWREHGALGTLRDRYAKGEISKEEYEEKKKVLES